MREAIENWDGDAWERHATQLLQLRHPNGSFQQTPSEYRGDLGIDGLVRSEGIAYQCYAAQEPLNSSELHEKQRGKILADTTKLISNRSDIENLLGNYKLKRWTLVVPRFTSTPLLGYCADRAATLRNYSFPFLDDHFEIAIEQRANFAREEGILFGNSPTRLPVPDLRPDDSLAQQMAHDQPTFLANITQKFSNKLERNPANDSMHSMLIQFLEGKNTADYLQTSFPPLFESLQEIRRRRERALNGLDRLSQPDPTERLREVRRSLDADLLEHLSALPAYARDSLRDSIVIEWLGICPLTLH